MAEYCLSRFPTSHPLSFSNINPKYCYYSVPISSRGNYNKLKIMAVDERNNLDHLQRQNKPPQPRKRSPQMAPAGKNQFIPF